MSKEIVLAFLGSAGLFSLIEVIIKLIVGRRDNKSTEKALLIAIAHDRIIFLCKEPLRRGSITSDELENINTIGMAYIAAGGNHLAKKYFEDTQRLPIKD